MWTQLERMSSPDAEPGAFAEADLAFHLAVAQASDNTVLMGTLASIRSLLRVWIDRVISAAASPRPSYEEHVPIYEAIRAGDAEAAADAMRAHMRSAKERLAQT